MPVRLRAKGLPEISIGSSGSQPSPPGGALGGGGDTLKEQKEATQAYSTEKQQEP